MRGSEPALEPETTCIRAVEQYHGDPSYVSVTSRLKAGFPNCADKLRLVATDPAASSVFYQSTIDAVLPCVLRLGASDGDGV